MTIRLKMLLGLIAVAMVPVFLLAISAHPVVQDDAAAVYKTKCVACHGAKAEKKFDANMADDAAVQIVLKGKKAEKPPNMPAYGEKGITEDQAKALVAFMKSQKH